MRGLGEFQSFHLHYVNTLTRRTWHLDIQPEFMFDQLKVAKLVDKERFVSRVEKAERLHPFQTVWHSVVIHQ